MPKETVIIDSEVLQPWREIAGILGMTVSEYLQRYLSEHLDHIRDDGLLYVSDEIEDTRYETREEAEAVTERFEAFAIESKLAGAPDVGIVAAEAVPTDDGDWTVKAHYLSPSAKRGWRSLSVQDDDDDE
jgi:hypothetical protein